VTYGQLVFYFMKYFTVMNSKI